jgi:hypothetical protein
MTGHEQIRRILASYRDATGAEQAEADAHVASCPACSDAFRAYNEVDALALATRDPSLPASLARPFPTLVGEWEGAARNRSVLGRVSARGIAPAAVIVVILAALSALLWSVGQVQAPVTTTPTLTMTLTPTTIVARETGSAAAALAAAPMPGNALSSAPTPAPAPAPRGNLAILFAGSPAHATISH